MQNAPIPQNDYVRKVLAANRQTPGTTGHVRPSDRLLAVQLHQRRIPAGVVENALVLAAARRLYRSLDAPPLAPVRSLHYFLPVIEEVSTLQVNPAYFLYLRHKIDTFEQAKQAFIQSRPT
jgi:hypothetical protein